MSAGRTERPESTGATPDAASAAAPRVCPLCGGKIKDSSENEHCPSCPVAKHCKILCCPHCGYEFVEDSAIVSGITGLIRRLRDMVKGKANGSGNGKGNGGER
jgi:hypothetical protein